VSLLSILEHGLRRGPERPMLSGGGRVITYGQGLATVSRIANALRAEGFGTGMRGSVLAGNDPLALLAAYGMQVAGLAYVPASSAATDDELARALVRFDVEVLFFQAALAARVQALQSRCPRLRRLVCLDAEVHLEGGAAGACTSVPAWSGAQPAVYRSPAPRLTDTASISQTGGTTGEPKGVHISHRARVAYVEKFWFAFHDPEPVMLAATPLTHAAGALAQPVFARGGRVHVIERAEPGLVLQAIEQQRITLLFLPPTAIYRLLDHPALGRTDCSSLRHFLYGAAPMSVARLREALRAFGPVMAQCYGQTECHSMITAMLPEDHYRHGEVAEDARLSSCGRPSLGTTVEIVDDQGARLPAGEVGEVRVHSDLAMSGYDRNPEATAAVLREGFVYTGDLGFLDDEGFLHLVDRRRDLIITGGFNVYPAEVEQVLASHPAVAECAVVGAPDADWGERVTGVVQLRPGMQATPQELVAHCRERLSGVKAPKEVRIWDDLPRSAVGKVMRRQVRAAFWPADGPQI
jgi:acyl-CoA synthetase (AMP-forming)/AMP-acid ligase II